MLQLPVMLPVRHTRLNLLFPPHLLQLVVEYLPIISRMTAPLRRLPVGLLAVVMGPLQPEEQLLLVHLVDLGQVHLVVEELMAFEYLMGVGRLDMGAADLMVLVFQMEMDIVDKGDLVVALQRLDTHMAVWMVDLPDVGMVAMIALEALVVALLLERLMELGLWLLKDWVLDLTLTLVVLPG